MSKISLRSYIILLLLALIWGSSFILIKISLEAFQPVHLGAMRLAIAGMAFFPILIHQFKRIDWSLWPFYLIVSLTGSGLPSFLFFIAQTEISSSISGLLNALTPIWTLLFAIILFNKEIIANQIIGVVLGLAGSIILILYGQGIGIQHNKWYGILVILATMCYGISVNVVKEYLQQTPSLVISSVALGFSGFLSLLFLLFSTVNESFTGSHQMWISLSALLILSLASTFIATILFYRLVKDTNAIFASFITFLIPIVALGWGMVDGELFTLAHVLAILLIFVGIYILNKKKPNYSN